MILWCRPLCQLNRELQEARGFKIRHKELSDIVKLFPDRFCLIADASESPCLQRPVGFKSAQNGECASRNPVKINMGYSMKSCCGDGEDGEDEAGGHQGAVHGGPRRDKRSVSWPSLCKLG